MRKMYIHAYVYCFTHDSMFDMFHYAHINTYIHCTCTCTCIYLHTLCMHVWVNVHVYTCLASSLCSSSTKYRHTFYVRPSEVHCRPKDACKYYWRESLARLVRVQYIYMYGVQYIPVSESIIQMRSGVVAITAPSVAVPVAPPLST